MSGSQRHRNVQGEISVLFDTVAVLLAFNPEIYEQYLAMADVVITVRDDGLTEDAADGRVVRAALHWRDLDGFEDLLMARLLAR